MNDNFSISVLRGRINKIPIENDIFFFPLQFFKFDVYDQVSYFVGHE